jgi:hypothetical protein
LQNCIVRMLQASSHEPTQWLSEACTPSQRSPPLHPLLPTLVHCRLPKGRPPLLLWRNPKSSNPLHLLKHLTLAGTEVYWDLLTEWVLGYLWFMKYGLLFDLQLMM